MRLFTARHFQLGGEVTMRTLVRFGLFFAVAWLASALHATDFPALGTVKRGGGFSMDGYWCWDASVIKGDDGMYHMFASRWPKDISFHPGWMTDSEVVHAVSATPEGPYTFKAVALPARGPEYWDGRATHNPTIRKHGDTYLLFYLGSTNPLGSGPHGEKFSLDDPRCIVARASKRIGLATAKSLDGPWQRSDRPILDTKPGTFYSFLTSNPAPVVHADGSVLMIFKSRRYLPNGKHSGMMLGLARAPHYMGPYSVVGNEPIFGPDKVGEVEDPFVWQNREGTYELIAKDMTGKIVGEAHAGIHALSKDGEHWQLAPKPKAWTRTLTFDDGKTETMGQLERPFILFEDGRPTYLFGAVGDGPGGFENMTKSGNIAIPLLSSSY
jgi:hypothetical protein